MYRMQHFLNLFDHRNFVFFLFYRMTLGIAKKYNLRNITYIIYSVLFVKQFFKKYF